MSYTLQKPYTQIQKADFIVLHNHQNGRKIEETPEALYALEVDEIMQDGEPVQNPNYAQEQLAAVKEAKLQENTTAYDAALKAGVTYKGELFDCDTLAAVRIMGQMVATQTAAIEEESTIDWFDYYYKPVTLTISEFMELAGLVTLNTRRIETLNCAFNTAIEAAQSLEELEAVVIDYAQEVDNVTPPQDDEETTSDSHSEDLAEETIEETEEDNGNTPT